MHCKDCKHATANKSYMGMYNCELILDINDYELEYTRATDVEIKQQTIDLTRAYTWDYESYSSGNYVGEMYGCIHFKE